MEHLEIAAYGAGEWPTSTAGHVGPVRFTTAANYLLVVTSGSGWYSDVDGTRRSLNAPEAVLWRADELVEYGTNSGWTIQYFTGPREVAAGFHPCD